MVNPVASSGSAEPSQRAVRGRFVCIINNELKVRANPMSNHVSTIRSDKPRCRKTSIIWKLVLVKNLHTQLLHFFNTTSFSAKDTMRYTFAFL